MLCAPGSSKKKSRKCVNLIYVITTWCIIPSRLHEVVVLDNLVDSLVILVRSRDSERKTPIVTTCRMTTCQRDHMQDGNVPVVGLVT